MKEVDLPGTSAALMLAVVILKRDNKTKHLLECPA